MAQKTTNTEIQKGHKKFEFNKLIVALSVVVAFAVTFWAIYRDAKGFDISNLNILIATVWVEVTGVTGTYAGKTKALNKIKMISSLPKEIRDQIDPNQILNS